MSQFQASSYPGPNNREAASEYLFDMIAQLAKLARGVGEIQAAIFLEAILAARLVTMENASS